MHTMMRGRDGKGGAPPTDLLVCFPGRTRLALMPKPARSPARSLEKGPGGVPSRLRNNHQNQNQNHHHRHHRRSHSQGGKGSSPTLWAKTKVMEAEAEEPTSPKVTCVGQIKVKSKSGSCKNWQSVMKEIERLHNCDKAGKKKKPSWIEALGLKKDLRQFLSCFRSAKLDLPCFGSLHPPVLSSDDDDDDEEEETEEEDPEHQQEQEQEGEARASEALFSKWYMVLKGNEEYESEEKAEEEEEEDSDVCPPPPNALLLMRCRSAPAKTWLEEKLIEEQEQEEARKAKLALEEKKKKENLILKYYGPDFYMVSSDIAKETWVVGGGRDPLARSRSWRR